MVEKVLLKHDTGLRVLARPQHFEQAGQISAANTANILNLLCEMFQYVVCDGPSRYDAAAPAILDVADMVVMVVNLVVPAVRNVKRIMDELSKQGYNLDRLKIVVNRHGTESAALDIDDLEEYLSRKVDFILPEDSKIVDTSINMGQPLLNMAPKSRIRESIRKLAEMIHDPSGLDGREPAASNTGILARMFSK